MTGLELRYLIIPLMHTFTSMINGRSMRSQQIGMAEQNRAQQEKMAKDSRELQEKMEQNRQHFQMEQNEKNAQFQRELALENHRLRLAEQQASFDNACKQIEWTRLVSTWPLTTIPSAIRAEQVDATGSDAVALRVIFAKSNDSLFSKLVYPDVERGILEFVDLYHNELNSSNIVFYHNGFTANAVGSYYDNIHYVLKGLPVIILDADVVNDRICVSITMWGFGNAPKKHFTVLTSPYQPPLVEGKVDLAYYRELTDRILAYMKFILAYAYDVYNLIEYNHAPLLPKVAALELKQPHFKGRILDNQEVKQAIASKYGEIYSMVIGMPEDSSEDSCLHLLESMKGSVLHKLRLEYAESMKNLIPVDTYIQYLDESLDAWVAIRSTEKTVEFLDGVVSGNHPVAVYVSPDDKKYLEQISGCYSRCTRVTPKGECCTKVAKLLKNCHALLNPAPNDVPDSKPERVLTGLHTELRQHGLEKSKQRNL